MNNEDLEVIRREMHEVFADIEKRASPEVLDELKSIGHAFDQYAWKAGWATERLYQECIANGGNQTVEECCWYVCIASFNGNRSMNTVKRYLHNARFFSPRTVAKYDALPFSTFEYARGHEKGWQYVLDFAMREAKKWSKPQSVVKLRQLIDGTKPKATPTLPHSTTLNMEVSMPSLTEDDVSDPPEVQEQSVLSLFLAGLDMVSRAIPAVAKMYPNLGISSARIVSILRQLEDAIRNNQDAEIRVPSP